MSSQLTHLNIFGVHYIINMNLEVGWQVIIMKRPTYHYSCIMISIFWDVMATWVRRGMFDLCYMQFDQSIDCGKISIFYLYIGTYLQCRHTNLQKIVQYNSACAMWMSNECLPCLEKGHFNQQLPLVYIAPFIPTFLKLT